MKFLIGFLLVFAGAAHASDVGISVGSAEGNTSYAVGIYAKDWGLEIGGVGYSNTKQYPSGSVVNEPKTGLDVVGLSDNFGPLRAYASLGAYFWDEKVQTPGQGAIVTETKTSHIQGAVGVGVRYNIRSFAVGVGYHTIRGPNASFIFAF